MPSKMSPEEELIRQACLANDEKLIDEYAAKQKARIEKYRAYTNNPFDPIYTKEVVASLYDKEEFPDVSIYHPAHPLNWKPRQ